MKNSTSNNEILFYHGGVEADFNYDKLDLLRPSEKQGSKYAGFYMYGEENLEGAITYANQENARKGTSTKGVEKITLDGDLKVYEEKSFGKITRLEKEYLEELQKQGYDVVSGKMMGKTEYVLLNKDKIKSMEFMPLDGSDPISVYSRPKDLIDLDTAPKNINLSDTDSLIPPNWTNDGSDIYLNRRYDEIIKETFGEYIDDFSKPMSVLWMPDKESGYKIAKNMYDNQSNFGLNLVRNYDSLIFEIHGTSSGLVTYQGNKFEPSTLIQRLEDTGIIPEDINRIYTSSCYGGLQNRGITKRGIPFESIHTSPVPTWGKGNTSSLDEIGESLQDIRLSMLENQEKIAIFFQDEDELKQIRAEREKVLKEIEIEKNKPRLVTNRLDEGVITDRYKKEVIGNYNKYGNRFADASFVATEEEIEHALWYLAKPSVEEEVKYYDGLIEKYHEFLKGSEGHFEFWRIQEAQDGVLYSEHINKTLERIADLKSTIAKYESERQDYLDIIEANKPYDKEDWHVSEERAKQSKIEYNFKEDNFGQYYFSDEMPAYKIEEKIPESNDNYNVNEQYSFLENDGSIKEEYIVKPKLTAQEAFNKYGPDSDEFYTSQGLDPVQQREAIKKLNSGRKPVDNTPIETKQFQQQLNNLGITEEEYYKRFNEEIMPKPRKQYTLVRGPKLKEIPKTPTVESIKPSKTSNIIEKYSNIYGNIQSLTEKELEAIDVYESGTRQDFRKIFEDYFEEEYDYSFRKFKENLLQKAKGKANITVSSEGSFVSALDKAFMQSSVYDVESYRGFKQQADEMFLHLGKTEQAQNMILDYIANGTDIDSDAIMKLNAKYFDDKLVNHGLYGFPSELYSVKGPTDNPLQRIRSNIQDIVSDSSIELSLSSQKYMVGPIGLTGTVNASVYHTNDIRSKVDWITGKRTYQPNKNRAVGTVEDIIDSIERKNNSLFNRHDELIGNNFKPTSLWVKEDFYSSNKKYVHSLLKEYGIEHLDLIHAAENIEKIDPSTIERLSVKDLDDLSIEKVSKKKHKGIRGPKLKQKPSHTIETDIKLETSSPKPEVSTPKPNKSTPESIPKQPNLTSNKPDTSIPHSDYVKKPKPSQNIASKNIPKKQMQTKRLNGGGIGSIVGSVVIGVAGFAVAKMVTDEHKEKKKTDRQIQNKDVQSQQIDNSYAMQMAQDISSYRYGKHMTGFVNY